MVKKMRPGATPESPDDIDRIVCDGCGTEIPFEEADPEAESHWCAECIAASEYPPPQARHPYPAHEVDGVCVP